MSKPLTEEQKQAKRDREKARYEANKQARIDAAKEAYASLSPEQKEKRLETQRVTRRKEKEAVKLTPRYRDPDGVWHELHPSWIPKIQQLTKKMNRHKAVFLKKLDRIQKWRDAGGLFPWPNLVDKAEISQLFVKICHLLGRRCSQCGTHQVMDFSWKLTRKDDILAWVPFTKWAYLKVIKNPEEYCFYCIRCAWDLKLYTFAWIFAPRSPRVTGVMRPWGGERYRNWDKIWPVMYPMGYRALVDKITSQKMKGLSCSIIMPDGTRKESIIKRNHYLDSVCMNPRDFSWHTMDQARDYYESLYPNVDCRNWSVGDRKGRGDLSFAKTKWDALGDDTRKFLREVTPPWEKLLNENHSRDWNPNTANSTSPSTNT